MNTKIPKSSVLIAAVFVQVHCAAVSAGTCSGAQMISTIAKDNRIVQLANGSRWQIARPDLIDVPAWHPNALVLTCDKTLVNLDINEDTVAHRLQ